MPYNKTDSYPEVFPIDFGNMEESDRKQVLDWDGLVCHPAHWYCENVYTHFLDQIKK